MLLFSGTSNSTKVDLKGYFEKNAYAVSNATAKIEAAAQDRAGCREVVYVPLGSMSK